ncbi:unnamed protein product [Closterium sp. NIES-53]
MACNRVLQQQGQPQHSRQWGPAGPNCYRRLDDLHRECFGPLAITPHWPSHLRQRTAAPVESHLPGLGPFPAARVETCVSSLGACVVSSPGASEGLCVGAAATTSLGPAFVFGLGSTSQTAQLSFTLDSGASSCLQASLAPLPRSPAPPCTPCVEGRQRTAPHSSSFPPTTAPFQTLHLDVWSPSPVLGPRQERYFLIVVDDYSRYTTVFPLRRKADVPTRHHRGGEFSSTRQERLCEGRGIILSYTLPASPQQNGVAERRIGLVMEVALTSMCHANAPQFLWPQAVRYATQQLNLWPSDARPQVTPVSLWTGSLGVAAEFRVWGSLAHVRAPGTNKLSPRTCVWVFLGFPLDASGWVFYDPVTYEFFASQDVTPPPVAPVALPPSRPAPSGVSHITSQSSPLQHPVPVMFGGAGGAVAEGHSRGGHNSLESAASPRVTPNFPSVPHFPPRSSMRPVVAEPGGVPAGGTGGPGGIGGGGAGFGGVGAGGTGTLAPTRRTERLQPQQERVEGESQVQQRVELQLQQERVEEVSRPHQERVEQESRPQQQQTPEEAERQRLRLRDLPDPAPARLVRGPLLSPPVPLVQSLSSSQWTRRSPLSCAASPKPRRSRYRADSPFHLVLRSRAPPPPVLPQLPESSLTVFHDPLSDYLRASRLVISRVLSALVTHPTAPLSSVSALVTTVAGFASSHRLDYTAHLVSGLARSSFSRGAPVFPLEVLEDRQFELGFLAATVPHLCAMLFAPEGDPAALDIPIPRTHAEEVKRSPGAPPVFKARYVVRGFSQREGVDFFQNFSPTPKMTTLRVLLHIAAQRGYELHSLDFSTAFLQGSLHEQIWLRRPPSFTSSFPHETQWQLRRPVYGLRQAPREWHDTLRTTLSALDFFPSSADPSLFVRRGSTPFFVLVYVDDLVVATPDRRALAFVKEELQRRHTCTDLGELQHYLGLQITRDRAARTITLTQSHMVKQILTRFCFPFSKYSPPLLLWIMGSRLQLRTSHFSPVVHILSCVLARFIAPGRHRPSHWYAAKRVAKYVASTSGMGLVLGGKQPVTLTGFSDSSWADDAESLQSTQGYCFSLGTGAVSWRSTLASSVSSSSCEAKVYATAMADRELRWLSFLLTDLGEWPCSPPVLFADNKIAILLCEEPRLVGKAKHIQLRYFLLRELQQRGQALVRRVVSEANTADIFTKALPPYDHQRFCTQLGLVSTGPHLLA